MMGRMFLKSALQSWGKNWKRDLEPCWISEIYLLYKMKTNEFMCNIWTIILLYQT